MSESAKEIRDRYSSDGSFLEQFQATYGVFNGQGQSDFNASAHALLSAGIAMQHSTAWTDLMGNLREWESYFLDENYTSLDSWRDVHNNRVGQQIGEFAKANSLPEAALIDLDLR